MSSTILAEDGNASDNYKNSESPMADNNAFEPTILDSTLIRRTANLGQDVSHESLTSDQESFTGQPNGFASKFVEGKLSE